VVERRQREVERGGKGGGQKFYFCGALYQGLRSVQGLPTGGGMQGLHLHLLIIVNQPQGCRQRHSIIMKELGYLPDSKNYF
jgi:hypothetical protein